ncbi:hypothetical protein [Clostridium ljungdahlii]|uniref:Uncharacterized protein n=1 Tax=Clostridium ljungdahlii (strain ATCC 55383 / DSM 13528 / PETC) TaxID=748727 RepID=D8GQ41_CLOLD|nr:hypothetical protein [Clostridium ljungdahlii]ADK16132.1 hypothetical protein CLJU_c30840 [Clostridium ljungdahlii DSM 13528]OAA84217.1 hypothetical protein WX45_01853 [Clostridium ljungdahlii DSM 13528]
MNNNSTWKQQVGQQLQVANQQINLCQHEIQQRKDCPDEQLFLQNALGAVAKAWEIIESNK